MCGIVGYVGKRQAGPILLEGLRRLEYRGYDSAGVAVVNAGTYGSEPHMPFGGLKNSGNGLREPGTEALAVYTETQTVYIHHNPDAA